MTREAVRPRTLLKGVVEYGTFASDCMVRDLTAGGARIQLAGYVALPQNFVLFIPQRKQRFQADLRWREGCFAGVMFSAEVFEHESVGPDGAAKRITELEAEVKRLRRELEKAQAGLVMPTCAHHTALSRR